MTEVLNSRRTFLKTAALGGAAMIGAGAAASAQAAPKKIAESTYDFVIVGAGCGGLVCAIRAAQNGLKPILIERWVLLPVTPFMPQASCSVFIPRRSRQRTPMPVTRAKSSMKT